MRPYLSLLFFAIRGVVSRVTRRDIQPLRIPLKVRGAGDRFAHVHLFPSGYAIPGFAGGEEETEEQKAERQRREAEQAERERAEREGRQPPTQADIDKAYNKLRDKEAEADRYKGERDALQAQLDAKEAEGQSELERTQTERDNLKAQIAEATKKSQQANLRLELAKPEHKINPQALGAAAKLIDGVEFGDDDQPLNTTARVEALLESSPFLKADPAANSDHTDRHNANRDRDRDKPGEMTAEESEKLLKDDPDKWNELMDEGKIPASALR